ncbi:zinc ribbon domain-containing protein [Microbacterium sp. 5K110]|jgi:putative FmdB family regulatory protein|uniref:FmdB family zinc ribbon protein n=1 Tax=unclassified Microbacterium TaxID=2609290 RepID=UPI0010FEB905|nr:zinc ribbon domain-containing protein [Microbacterium sp. 5K110]
MLYDYRCPPCGERFELRVPSMNSATPLCPSCGSDTLVKLVSGVRIGGAAAAGPARSQMPRSWQATRGGDRDVVRGWRDAAVRRERLEERHPELAPDRRPVLAHEGRFADRPLRAGDPWPSMTAPGSAEA